jgi:hypothetical protein
LFCRVVHKSLVHLAFPVWVNAVSSSSITSKSLLYASCDDNPPGLSFFYLMMEVGNIMWNIKVNSICNLIHHKGM